MSNQISDKQAAGVESKKLEVFWVYHCLKIQIEWPYAGARLAFRLPRGASANV